MRVLTAAEMRAADRRAIEELGVPPLVLMENAALGVVEALAARFPAAERVAILCGPGNNGGDGLAVARQLLTRGYDVRVALAPCGRDLSPDCAAQLAICRAIGLDCTELPPGADLGEALEADLLVDALFGTGLARPLEGEWARLVETLAALPVPVLAVDLPSGLDADRQRPIGPFLPATLTVTFAAPKPAHVLAPAADGCGEVVVADLGVPLGVEGGPGALHLLVAEELAAWLVERPRDAHKGLYGHVLLVAGGRGMAGAAILAARASVLGGAGLTTVAAPGELLAALAAASPESMALAVAASPDGALDESAAEALVAAAAARSVVAVGPGIGRASGTTAAIARLVLGTDRPVVLDADGLAAFEGGLERLAARSAPTVLTPHPGELGRLLGRSSAEIQADRLGAAREAAARSGAVVVLKGDRTVIAAPDAEAWINESGSPAMATGGSGDVLTGLLAARLAQGDEPTVAAALAVHLHGLAGELAAGAAGGPALPAGRLAEAIPAAYRRLSGR